MITTRTTSVRGRLLSLVMMAVLVAGCAADPLKRVEQIERGYGVTLDAAHVAVDAGLIKPGSVQAITLDAARKEADAAIAALSKLTIAGEPVTRDFYIERAASAAARFAAVLAQAREAPK